MERGRDLIKEGHIELLGLLESIDTKSIAAESACRIDRLRGEVLALLGRFDEAEEAFSQARPPAEAAGLNDVIADILSNLADIALKRGDSDASLNMHRKALELFISMSDALGAARSYNNMGYILRRNGDKAKALEAYSEVENILQGDDSLDLIPAQIVLARSLLDLGEHIRARDHALSSYERSESSEDPILHARARAVLGRYYAKTGDADLALHHYTDALSTMGEAGDPLALVEVSILLGEVLQDSGRIEEALESQGEYQLSFLPLFTMSFVISSL